MTQFHTLTIRDIRKETADCVSIAFDVPADLAEQFAFHAGQNITLRLPINGEEIRRSYSICSSPDDNELRIAVKHVDEGKFSAHANRNLKPGDKIDVLPPTGRFTLQPDATRNYHYVAFAAGSGITPIISIIKTVLRAEPQSRFTLIYGNRQRSSIIFKEELDALKNRYMERFAVIHVLSREHTDVPVQSGRIDVDKCEQLSRLLFDVKDIAGFFICGPEEMIFSVKDWLLSQGVGKDKIHFELFNVPGEKAGAKQVAHESSERKSTVRLKLDGVWVSYELAFDGSSVLDGALQQGADLPYACKGGVCATCRAKLIQGKVEMDTNYALEQDELDAGYILTCQSHPRSDEVVIDFDAR